MKLFISYSRDDKEWVYELWRGLRDRAHHDAWIDQRIVLAQDWWETILQHIEACDAFLYVMSPKAVASIYCSAELAYAIKLNKPILPLMLKPCDYPAELKKRRIQYYTITEGDGLGDVLFIVAQGMTEIRVGMIQGTYPPPEPMPSRPDEPRPERKPEQVSEVFMLAEEAASQNNITLAEKLFQQVIEADPQGYGLAAGERLNEIRSESSRNAEYLTIAQMAANRGMWKGATAAWRVYVSKYGTDYDPNGLVEILADKSQPQAAATPDNHASADQGLNEAEQAIIEPLIMQLRSKDNRVSQQAAEALVEMGEIVVRPLVNALDYGDLRGGAVYVLGQLGEAAVEPLIGALASDDKGVRSSATALLGKIGDARAVEPLIMALSDKDVWVRRSAAEALGRIGDAGAVGPLIAALVDQDEVVGRTAGDALMNLGEVAVRPLIAALGDEDGAVRASGIAVLVRIGEVAVRPLIAALGNENETVRVNAADALIKIGTPEALKAARQWRR